MTTKLPFLRLSVELLPNVLQSCCQTGSPVAPAMSAIPDTVFVRYAQFPHFDMQRRISNIKKIVITAIDPESNGLEFVERD